MSRGGSITRESWGSIPSYRWNHGRDGPMSSGTRLDPCTPSDQRIQNPLGPVGLVQNWGNTSGTTSQQRITGFREERIHVRPAEPQRSRDANV